MDIDKILLKVMNDQASREEYEALEAWKLESQENLALLQEISKSQSVSSTPYKEYDKDKAWKKVEAQIDPLPHSKPTKISLAPAYILLGVTLAILAFLLMKEDSSTNLPSHYEAATETNAFALQDDSKIWLREGGSTIEVLSQFESANERRVALSGEAFFDIKKDSKPFVIELSNNDYIEVVGTSFNVINNDQELDICVYSGTVILHTLDRKLKLNRGDKASRVLGSIVINKNTESNKLSWKSNELVFDDMDLGQVFETLSKHYKVDIQLDPSANTTNCRIRDRFKEKSIAEVLEALAKHTGFEYQIKEQNISISRLSCS